MRKVLKAGVVSPALAILSVMAWAVEAAADALAALKSLSLEDVAALQKRRFCPSPTAPTKLLEILRERLEGPAN